MIATWKGGLSITNAITTIMLLATSTLIRTLVIRIAAVKESVIQPSVPAFDVYCVVVVQAAAKLTTMWAILIGYY